MRKSHASLTNTGICLITCSICLALAAPAQAQLTSADIVALRAQGQQDGWTFTVGENPATAVPLSELCGLVAPDRWQDNAPAEPLPAQRSLPAAYDWHNLNGQNLCPPVRNQGGCGSCWAFGTVGPLECNIKINTGQNVDLSEQWLVSCNRNGWSCNGGWWAHDYHQFATDVCGGTGAVYESDYPYTASNSTCACPKPHAYLISGWGYVGGGDIPPVASLKQAVMDYGPISVAVYVTSAFQGYTGGVFNACVNGSVNHAVTLVGWNDAQSCWIVRNSWGPNWGESGYMRIAYNCSMIGYGAAYIVYSAPAATISGYVRNASGQGIASVRLTGLPGSPYTDSNGFYTTGINANWSGTVTPSRPGFTFDPPSQNYNGVTSNQTQDYTGTAQTFTLTGFVKTADGLGVAGVAMNGLPGNPLTDSGGAYSVTADFGWGGVVTPAKDGYTFDPPGVNYPYTTADTTVNYAATLLTLTISGFVKTATGAPVANVALNGLPGTPTTNYGGAYTASVPYGWSGTVKPTKTACRFGPIDQDYAALAGSQTQDYKVGVFGDMNCDGFISYADINPFILALTGSAAYQTANPACDYSNADCNDDGQVNYGDINAFVHLLTGL